MKEVGLVPLVAFSPSSRGKCQNDTLPNKVCKEGEKDSLREGSGEEALKALNPLPTSSPRRRAG